MAKRVDIDNPFSLPDSTSSAASQTAEERIEHDVVNAWFLTEPALHATLLTHERVANEGMECAIRVGHGRIEYNPQLIGQMSVHEIEETFRLETLRILLKHPYQRQPDAPPSIRLMASNMVLADNYSTPFLKAFSPRMHRLRGNESFEWYATQLMHKNKGLHNLFPNKDSDPNAQSQSDPSQAPDELDDETEGLSSGLGEGSGKGSGDDAEDDYSGSNKNPNKRNGKPNLDDLLANLLGESGDCNGSGSAPSSSSQEADSDPYGDPTDPWNHNPSQRETKDQNSAQPRAPMSQKAMMHQAELWEEDEWVEQQINDIIERTASWGSVPGNIVETIIASTKPRVDYRRVLGGFRASVISQRRNLTRMRPNRRTGFQNMGSVYKMVTHLLVAVDVSGSVGSKDISNFYGIVSKFFNYGIESIDTMQFDHALGDVIPLKKAPKEVKVRGRGGTSFDIIFDFMAQHPEYDGMIVFTDGFCEPPHITGRRPKVAWVLCDKECYETNGEMLSKFGRVCYIDC